MSSFPPIRDGLAARLHRINGRVALVTAVAVAFLCIAGPAGPVSPTRVLVHTIFGAIVFVALAAKFTLLRLARKGERLLPFLGTAVFISFGVLWATSVADFVATR